MYISAKHIFGLFVKDTLYLHYGRQYLRDCYIEGSVDFIFGNSTALLEHCHIHCKSQGYITAQSRKSSQETTGYVFLRCVCCMISFMFKFAPLHILVENISNNYLKLLNSTNHGSK